MTDGTAPWTAAAAEGQRQLLQMIERGQEAIVQAVQQWRETGGDWRAPDLSGAMELADPETVLKMQFEFAERVLAAQRRFAEQLLAAVHPTGK